MYGLKLRNGTEINMPFVKIETSTELCAVIYILLNHDRLSKFGPAVLVSVDFYIEIIRDFVGYLFRNQLSRKVENP